MADADGFDGRPGNVSKVEADACPVHLEVTRQ
jgi:hypothetical protein